MTRGTLKTGGGDLDEREFALRDVVDFLRSNALFIGLLTLLIAVAVVVLSLLPPQQYSKQFVLDVIPVPTELLQSLNQPVLDDVQASNLAVESLQSAGTQGVSVSPTYDPSTSQIEVTVQSEDREDLDEIGSRLPEVAERQLRNVHEELLAAALDTRISDSQDLIGANKSAIASLEREMEGLNGASDPQTLARLEGLESARGSVLAEIARSEAGLRDLEATRDDLPRLAEAAVSVEVLSESQNLQSRSLVPVVALAVMLGLVGAVVAALVRTALRRSR